MRAAMRVRSNCQETAHVPAQRKTTPVISLIVCTLRRRDTLHRLFESLAMQTFQDFEVVVVDQNPPGFLDEVIDHYRSRFVIVHVSAAPGLSAARNIGLGRATGGVIALPDDDCWYDPDTLVNVLMRIEADKSIAIVSGRTTDGDGQSSVSVFLRHASQISRRNYLKCGNSNCLFFRREVFQEIGHFDVRLGAGSDTGFHSGEEADVLLRALDAGLVAQYFPDLKVRHSQVDDVITRAHIQRARNYGRGFGALLRKHRFSTFEIAYRIIRPLLGAALCLLSGKAMRARYRWAWGRSIAEGYRRWPLSPGRRSFETR
jgi:glycosyltransferase involved in cell wall biosynthesis